MPDEWDLATQLQGVPSLTKGRQVGWVVGTRVPGLIAGAGVGCLMCDWAGLHSTIYDGNLTPPGLGGALSSGQAKPEQVLPSGGQAIPLQGGERNSQRAQSQVG